MAGIIFIINILSSLWGLLYIGSNYLHTMIKKNIALQICESRPSPMGLIILAQYPTERVNPAMGPYENLRSPLNVFSDQHCPQQFKNMTCRRESSARRLSSWLPLPVNPSGTPESGGLSTGFHLCPRPDWLFTTATLAAIQTLFK